MTRSTRRALLGRTAALAAALPLARLGPRRARADELTFALVGCGRQGTAQAERALRHCGPLRLLAVADLFEDRVDACLERLGRQEGVDVPPERRFVGFDGYRRALDAGVDAVLFATPPAFRPLHFEHAVRTGVHAFLEKPLAVDGAGVSRLLRAGGASRERELKVGVGLQRRHSARYRAIVERVRAGEIGEPVMLRCYGNTGGVWREDRRPEQSELEYQLRNWYYFSWLSGDFIVEEHVDGLDVASWVRGTIPDRAQGQGGRQVRTGPEHGNIYDHHAIEYTWDDGVVLQSWCRQIPNTWGRIDELVRATDGSADLGNATLERKDGTTWAFSGDEPDPYRAELQAFFDAVRDGTPHHELDHGTASTLTAILGRMASYRGQEVTRQVALGATEAHSVNVDVLDWSSRAPVRPLKDGTYFVPSPGQFKRQ